MIEASAKFTVILATASLLAACEQGTVGTGSEDHVCTFKDGSVCYDANSPVPPGADLCDAFDAGAGTCSRNGVDGTVTDTDVAIDPGTGGQDAAE